MNKKTNKKATESKKQATPPVATASLPKSLAISIDGQSVPGIWKINKETGEEGFKTGSKGWSAMGKIFIAGVRCQVSCNIIIIGSKPEEA